MVGRVGGGDDSQALTPPLSIGSKDRGGVGGGTTLSSCKCPDPQTIARGLGHFNHF